jgi:hypothetical protein
LDEFDCAGFVRGLWVDFLIFFETLSVDINEKKSKGEDRRPQKTPDQFIQTSSKPGPLKERGASVLYVCFT